MKVEAYAWIICLLSVFLQETLMADLAVWQFQADLVLLVVISVAFFVPPAKLDFMVFITGLLRGFVELPVINSLGFYPLVYLVLTTLVSRLIAPFFSRALRHRLPFFIIILLFYYVLRFLIWLLIAPELIRFNWLGLAATLANLVYTILVWLLLNLVLFRYLEERQS